MAKDLESITAADLARNGFVRVGPYYRAFGLLFTLGEARRMLAQRQVPPEPIVNRKKGRPAKPKKGVEDVLPM